MRTYWLMMALAASGAGGALASSKPPDTPQEHAAGIASIEDGRQLFATYCASCHGASGHGDGPVGAALHVRPPDLALLAKRDGDQFVAARIERIIDGRDVRAPHGTMEMPVWGDAFTRREGLSELSAKARIQAIVRYLASIQARSS